MNLYDIVAAIAAYNANETAGNRYAVASALGPLQAALSAVYTAQTQLASGLAALGAPTGAALADITAALAALQSVTA